MTIAQALIAFAAAATLLSIMPGVDTALVLRTAAAGGARRAVSAALGIGLGCLSWGAAVSLGLGALLAASPLAFTMLKWVGAAYLFWLGVRLIAKPRGDIAAAAGPVDGKDVRGALIRGFLSNILNPKVGIFYVTFLPQFVPEGMDVAGFSFLLACIHVVLGMAWFTMLIAATVPLGRLLARPQVIRALDRVMGGVFIVFGIRLALARPH